MTAAELAAAARGFMEVGSHPDSPASARDGGTAVLWPRAVALLGRQALEQGLDALWGAVAPPVKDVSRHAQLLCLGAYVPHEDLVSDVRHAWHGLSDACHHQVYELAPTAIELGLWLDGVDRFLRYDPTRLR